MCSGSHTVENLGIGGFQTLKIAGKCAEWRQFLKKL